MTWPSRVVDGRLWTERMKDGRRRLLLDFTIEVEGERYLVPINMRTDFSTIPWFGRILVRWSKVDIAGVVHDWLYQTAITSRAKADRIWRVVAMSGEHHANLFQGWVGWAALRVGGWVSWRRHRQTAN